MIHKLFYFGFLLFVASTILFIVSILTRYWILRDNFTRGIFEVCTPADLNSIKLDCKYILLYSDDPLVLSARRDYSVACSSLSIIASALGIIFMWVAGVFFCAESKTLQKVISSLMIAGTILVDCTTIVVWIVMLSKNLDSNNYIDRNQIGWSLWCAVGASGGYLIALVLFCMHRIDIAISPYISKRQDSFGESREYLQRF